MSHITLPGVSLGVWDRGLITRPVSDRPRSWSLNSLGDHSPDTMKFPDISLMIRGTPDHFNWYSYHACTTSVKVNDQTVKFIFNDSEFIMITKSLLTQLWKFWGNFPWQDFLPDNSLTFPWLLSWSSDFCSCSYHSQNAG